MWVRALGAMSWHEAAVEGVGWNDDGEFCQYTLRDVSGMKSHWWFFRLGSNPTPFHKHDDVLNSKLWVLHFHLHPFSNQSDFQWIFHVATTRSPNRTIFFHHWGLVLYGTRHQRLWCGECPGRGTASPSWWGDFSGRSQVVWVVKVKKKLLYLRFGTQNGLKHLGMSYYVCLGHEYK